MILASLGSMFYGFALGVLSWRSYSMQREVLKGSNPNAALGVGVLQAVMGSLLLATLNLAMPALGPYAYIVNSFGFILSSYPILAGLAGGGYAHIKHSWHVSKNPLLISIVDTVDYLLSFIPESVLNLSNEILMRTHPLIGSAYFGVQIAAFTLIGGFVQPLLGVAGLSYLGLGYARAKNWLPKFISKPLESFNYWVGLFSGPFLKNTVLKVAAIVNIGWEFMFNVAAPRFFKHYLGEKSEFLQVADMAAVQRPASRIQKEISLEDFTQLEQALPSTKAVSDATSASQRAAFLGDEVGNLLDQFLQEASEIPGLRESFEEERRLSREREDARLARPGFFTQTKYYAQDTLYSMKYMHKFMEKYFPHVRSFLDKKDAALPYSMTVAHMARVPSFMPPIPTIDFNQLLERTLASFVEHPESANTLLTQACLKSPKFPDINLGMRAELRGAINGKDSIKYEESKLNRRLDALTERRDAIQVELQQVTARLERQGRTPAQIANSYLVEDCTAALSRLNQNIEEVTREKDALRAQIPAFEETITRIRRQLIDLWKAEFALPANAADLEVFRQYNKLRLEDAFRKIETGEDLLWDKTTDSLEDFKKMGALLLDYAQELLNSGDPDDLKKFHEIMVVLSIEGGDYCANGIYEVVKRLFMQHVMPRIFAQYADQISPDDKFALYLQDRRQQLFDQMYHFIKEHPASKEVFAGIDFDDAHTYSQIVQGVSVLNLKAKFNAASDISNNQVGFMTRLMATFYGYLIARVMMLVDHGYSVDNILEGMSKQNIEGDSQFVFNVGECVSAWGDTFANPDVQAHIQSIARAPDSAIDEYRKEARTTIKRLLDAYAAAPVNERRVIGVELTELVANYEADLPADECYFEPDSLAEEYEIIRRMEEMERDAESAERRIDERNADIRQRNVRRVEAGLEPLQLDTTRVVRLTREQITAMLRMQWVTRPYRITMEEDQADIAAIRAGIQTLNRSYYDNEDIIADLKQKVGSFMSAADKARKHLYAMMMIDQSIIRCNDIEAKAELDRICPQPPEPEPVPPSPFFRMLDEVQSAAVGAGSALVTTMYETYKYATAKPTEDEIRQRRLAEGEVVRRRHHTHSSAFSAYRV